MKNELFLFTSFLLFIANNSLGSGFGKDSEITRFDREQQQLEWCFIYSNILGFNINYVNNPRLYNAVCEWMGVPYKYSGKSKNGIDCSGFICKVYRDCYKLDLTGNASDIYRNSKPIRRSELQEGDLVFFKINKKRITHVGIYLGQNRFVHASSHNGVMVSDLDDPYFQQYFFKGGRMIFD
jgi:lipoprotein Spr